jgi:hypothetical protein
VHQATGGLPRVFAAPAAAAGRAVRRTTPRVGHHRGMTSAAEISSLSSTLSELHERVTALAESALANGDEDMAHELIAVERALGGALRRLRRFGQGQGPRR